jgi:hypothetical protein
MLLYTPESNIGMSMTDLPVQFGVPLKHSIIFLIHKTPIQKLTHVLVLCRHVLNNLGVCHTPFRDRGNEASIHVPRMFHSHV